MSQPMYQIFTEFSKHLEIFNLVRTAYILT